MKKLLFYLFATFVLLVVGSLYSLTVHATYFTPNLISKAQMTYGLNLNVCPVNLTGNSIKNLTDPKVSIEDLDAAYNAGLKADCAGANKQLTIGYVDFLLRKDSTKKVSDILFMLDDKIFNASNPTVISIEDPNNPDDFIGTVKYLESKKIYNFDPSHANGPFEKIKDSFLLTAANNQNQEEAPLTDEDLKGFPSHEATLYGELSKKIICPDATDATNPYCKKTVIVGSNTFPIDKVAEIYSKKEFTNDWDCSKDDSSSLQSSKIVGTEGTVLVFTCIRGTMSVDVILMKNSGSDETLIMLVPTKIVFKTLLMFEGQLYKFVSVSKVITNFTLLDYTNLSKEELDKSKVTLPSTIDEFPIYSEGEFINKSYISDEDCLNRDWDIQIDCGVDTYMLISPNDKTAVTKWYQDNIDKSKWDCKYTDMSANYQDVNGWEGIDCENKDESLDFSARRFHMNIKPIGNVISEIMIGVPKKISSDELSESVKKAIGDFPLFEGTVLQDSGYNKDEVRLQQNKDLGPETARYMFDVKYDSANNKYYEYTDKILNFYKSGPGGWVCTHDRLNDEYDLGCKKGDKLIGVSASGSKDGILLTITVPAKIDRSKYIPIPESFVPAFSAYPGSSVVESVNLPCKPNEDETSDIDQCKIKTLSEVKEDFKKVTKWYTDGNASPLWKCPLGAPDEQLDSFSIIHCTNISDPHVDHFDITIHSLDWENTKTEITQEIDFKTP